jgi:hypothetical protein
MQLEITVRAESGLEPMYEQLRGIAGAARVRLQKTDGGAMSVHDAVSVVVEDPETAEAIAIFLGELFGELGNRAKVTVTKNGAVVADRVSSRAAAKIVKDAVAL